ncbi:MAG: hypothetical protein JSR45_03705 [Proteobacteria bacterium]|nr:hypothetical protein [Pseudomonadota bacterium]
MQRIVIAAVAALIAGQAAAQAPASAPSLSPAAADLKQACPAQVQAAIVHNMSPVGGHMDRAAATHDVDDVMQQVANMSKDEVRKFLGQTRSNLDQTPPAYNDFVICIFERRLTQPQA